jgi:hypothetical protein
MDNDNHTTQAEMYLRQPLRRFLAEQGLKAFIGVNSFVYYQTRPAKAKGPDFYVVNGGEWTMQGSWVIPAENGLKPTLIVELLSPSTEVTDRTTKKDFYETIFQTPDYGIYDTENQRFEAWHRIDGVYRPVAALASGRIPCQSLPLHLGVHGRWLRWFLPDGTMLPTDEELRKQAEELKKQAVEQTKQERERRVRMARRLLQSGMSLEEVVEMAELAPEDLTGS